MKARTIFWGIALFSLSFAIVTTAKAQITNAAFQQAVTAFQQSPSDETAGKVIKMASTMRQLPPIPEEARHHFVRGAALFKAAKSQDDSRQAAIEFTQAVALAPWWKEAWYNLAMASEAGGEYGVAISDLKVYLLFKLPAADARAAQDKIYVLEAKQEQADKEKAEADAAAQSQQSVPPPPQPADNGPSLEATMKYIQDKVNEQGEIGYISTSTNVLTGGTNSPNQMTDKSQVVSVDPVGGLSFLNTVQISDCCVITFKWQVDFKDIGKMEVLLSKDICASQETKPGVSG